MNVKFAVRLHKAEENSEGKSPVMLQITFNRKVRRKSMGIWISQDQFYLDEDKEGQIRNVSNIDSKRKIIAEYRKRSKRILEDHFIEKEFNYKEFAKLLDSKIKTKSFETVEVVKVAKYCKMVSNDFIANGQIRSGMDYKYLSNLILTISPNDIHFDDFDLVWLKKVEKYYNSREASGKNNMHRLKILYGKAVGDKFADFKKNPFKNPYTNPYGYDLAKFNKRRLTKTNPNRMLDIPIEKLKELRDYIPLSEKESEYLDVWWFSFYCFGVNMPDIAPLEKRHIINDRWHYERSKTGVGLRKGKPLVPEAIEIIERWSKKNPDSKYIFPILSNGYDETLFSKANRERDYVGYIRKMAVRVSKRLGWEEYFTFYSARHSSLTIALNSGVDRNTVSHLADHKNLSTLDHYAGRANDSNILNAMETLRF